MSDQPPSNEDLNRPPTEEELNRLQLTTLQYYLHETNPATGLIRDKTDPECSRQHRRGRSRRWPAFRSSSSAA